MTTLQLRRLKHLVEDEGLTIGEAAETIGARYDTARRWLKKLGVPVKSRWRKEKRAQYAAYCRWDGTLVVTGTVEEVAETCGLSVWTVRCAISNPLASREYEIVRLKEETT